MPRNLLVPFSLLAILLATGPTLQAKPEAEAHKSLSFVDLMKFRTIVDPAISDDGTWVAYELRPDRGDGEVEIRSTDGKQVHHIPRGQSVALTPDGSWVAALVLPTLEDREAADSDDPDSAPKSGLQVLSTDSSGSNAGTRLSFERVERFSFSKDGQWLLIHHAEEPAEDDEEAGTEGEPAKTAQEVEVPEAQAEPSVEEQEGEEQEGEKQEGETDEPDPRLGTTLVLHHLSSGAALEIQHVETAAIAETSDFLAFSVAAPEGANGLFILALTTQAPDLEDAIPVLENQKGRYTALSWAESSPSFGFIAAVDDEDGEPGEGALWLWQGESREGREAITSNSAPEGWHIPSVNKLTWSQDGERLFFGFKPRLDAASKSAEDDAEAAFDPFDVEAILEDTELDVWHVKDPLIKTNERHEWETEKDRTYLAVHHLDGSRTIELANTHVREVKPTESTQGIVGFADVDYLRERTWDGFYSDLHWISLETGTQHLVAQRTSNPEAQLSPNGRWLAWYQHQHWHLYDSQTGTQRNLTRALAVPFTNEDHDYPEEVPGYGSPGFVDDNSAVLIYDKFDLWRFPVDPGASPVCLTGDQGRAQHTQFRLWDLDPETDTVPKDGPWLISGYRDRTKNDSLWRLDPSATDPATTLAKIHEADKRFTLKAKAKDVDLLLFTQESYREFPDLWVGTTEFAERKRLSNANPQVADFPWGHAELVDWQSVDGDPLQGILIRPETLDEGDRCPVLIYYYRFFSQRLHRFNDPKVNHRPSFPVYASNGYCVFLPDIRFEIGRPGFSATKALVPGVQKLVDLGIADPDALGLHGHSWSGYQTAFVVTQTNIFAAAVAGAPVTNMTSAYGGIRYGTGLARQFQYEKSQSRLGKSLWEGRSLYIDNSPLFFADRIQTPLLMQFGDADGAVPWTQGVELYLALRRLDKEAILLQYRGEPHHLKKYANKLDYAIKMKQYFDHYLKGAPAPAWMTEGVAYRGDD